LKSNAIFAEERTMLFLVFFALVCAKEVVEEGNTWLGMMRRVLSLRVFQTFDKRMDQQAALKRKIADDKLPSAQRQQAQADLFSALFADVADRANHEMLLDAQRADCATRDGVYDAKLDRCVITIKS
jgi:hypothetical protein